MKRLVCTSCLEASDCGSWPEWLLWPTEEQPSHQWCAGTDRQVPQEAGNAGVCKGLARTCFATAVQGGVLRGDSQEPTDVPMKERALAPASQRHLSQDFATNPVISLPQP